MKIESIIPSRSLGDLKVVYEDAESVPVNMPIHSVHGYCFYKDKLVVVFHGVNKYWTPPGGSVELGETWQEATIREIKEESNMKVINQQLIGYQEIFLPDGTTTIQTRAICIVEPYGDFIADPDEDITKIKLIDPKDYKEYFDWGEIGEHIAKRAMELLNLKINSSTNTLDRF